MINLQKGSVEQLLFIIDVPRIGRFSGMYNTFTKECLFPYDDSGS